MKVDEKLLQHVADVARLKLTKGEINEFLPQLQEILNAFSELDKVETSGIKPSFQPVAIKNVMRDDIKKEPLTNEDALSNTNHKKDGYFKGPRAV